MGLTTGPLRYIRRPLEANIRPGNRVLVLSDTRHDPRVWQAVLTILADLGTDATLALFEPRPADYYDPPPLVCDAMKHSDFNILLCGKQVEARAQPCAFRRGPIHRRGRSEFWAEAGRPGSLARL